MKDLGTFRVILNGCSVRKWARRGCLTQGVRSTGMSYDTEFGDDPGTLWTSGDGIRIEHVATSPRTLRRELRKRAHRLPIVWIVDDEQASRNWFVENHRHHYALITFSSRDRVVKALQANVPCDIVVTDVFFPAKTPRSQGEEQALLSVYERIEQTTISKLPDLWDEVRKSWQLHGFTVARDVVEWAARRKEAVPVILYSRKAPLLLSDDEWLADPAAVRNTYWMTEKIDPNQTGDVVRRIADIQRNRINALLTLKQESAPQWMKVLSGFGLTVGPFQYSLSWLDSK
jgi:hypothetical protein